MTRPTPVILYDTTLRDGTQGENITLSLADKLRVARMLDEYGFPFIEGGWPGSNPKDIEFFAARPQAHAGSTRSSPRSAAPATRPTSPADDPNLRELVAAETPVVTIFGKSWLLHVTEVLGATPAQNLDMIADSIGFIVDHGREAVYDAEHFFDGYKADRDYALATLRAARRGRRPHARPVRHQRRHADRRAGPDPRRRPGLARGRHGRPGRDLGHPHPQRRGARGGQLDRRGAGRASATSRPRSTATASAAATRTWCRSWPTSRSRRRTTSPRRAAATWPT